ALQGAAQPCRLAGTIAGLGSKPVIFWYTQKGVGRSDTVRARGDRFTYAAQPSDDGLISLYISGNRFARFWYEPGQLAVTGNAAEPWKLTIAGTPENNVLNQYNHEVEWKYEQPDKNKPLPAGLKEQRRQAALQFIKSHPASRTSTDALYWQLAMNERQVADYEQVFNNLPTASQHSLQGQRVSEKLAAIQSQPIVGRVAPDFSMADTAGVLVSLAAYRGKYVLLDFWGHWCAPCLESMPKLKAMHAQYVGRLAIIGVALEGPSEAAKWKRAILANQLGWPQLSELKGIESPVIKRYNITAFPTYMLLDRQGMVVARGSDATEIAHKLATLNDL
ncbi:MAG: redoxin domain-containing protein, partial [Hymenobacter sp.]